MPGNTSDHVLEGDMDLVFNLCDRDDKDKTSTVQVKKAMCNDKFLPVVCAAVNSLEGITGKI